MSDKARAFFQALQNRSQRLESFQSEILALQQEINSKVGPGGQDMHAALSRLSDVAASAQEELSTQGSLLGEPSYRSSVANPKTDLELNEKVNSLLQDIDQLYANTDFDFDYPEHLQYPPPEATLKMTTVAQLVTNPEAFAWVVEPQDYLEVSRLSQKDENNFMLNKDDGEYGLFHTGTSGLAQSGDGDDYGDLWWEVNSELKKWLQQRKDFLSSVNTNNNLSEQNAGCAIV